MIEVRPATADEMVLAFLRAEVDSPTSRGAVFANALAHIFADRSQLVDRGDLNDSQQNYARCWVLGYARGYRLNQYLFKDFPDDIVWRLFIATPAEVKCFKYVNQQDGWAGVSGSSRLVTDGVKNLDRVQNPEFSRNVNGIAARVRRGERFPPLIAVQCSGATDVVLMEGHTRATAYALTESPHEIEVLVGTSAQMHRWGWFEFSAPRPRRTQSRSRIQRARPDAGAPRRFSAHVW